MNKQKVLFRDLGVIDYKSAWDYQEDLVNKNRVIKSEIRNLTTELLTPVSTQYHSQITTTNHLLFCEHPPVYTLGKSGSMNNILVNEKELEEKS